MHSGEKMLRSLKFPPSTFLHVLNFLKPNAGMPLRKYKKDEIASEENLQCFLNFLHIYSVKFIVLNVKFTAKLLHILTYF